MSGKHFQVVALLAALLHLGDGLLASWGHSHGPKEGHVCHQVAEHAGHHHHGESVSDGHEENDPDNEHESSLPCRDDSDHCAACRHLAQATAHQFVLLELPTVERVAPVCCRLELTKFSNSAHDYLSRGPPAIAL